MKIKKIPAAYRNIDGASLKTLIFRHNARYLDAYLGGIKPALICYFGSAARRSMEKDSDVDVFVYLDIKDYWDEIGFNRDGLSLHLSYMSLDKLKNDFRMAAACRGPANYFRLRYDIRPLYDPSGIYSKLMTRLGKSLLDAAGRVKKEKLKKMAQNELDNSMWFIGMAESSLEEGNYHNAAQWIRCAYDPMVVVLHILDSSRHGGARTFLKRLRSVSEIPAGFYDDLVQTGGLDIDKKEAKLMLRRLIETFLGCLGHFNVETGGFPWKDDLLAFYKAVTVK